MGIVRILTNAIRLQAVARVAQPKQTFAPLELTKRLNIYLRSQFAGNGFVRFPISTDSCVTFDSTPEKIAGGVIYFDQTKSRDKPIKLVLIGDIHAALQNFNAIINKYRAGLEDGSVQLVFLGDLIHPERGSDLENMTTSIQIMRQMMVLMEQYPGQIHWVRGDHENLFDGNLHKGFIFQCDEMRKALASEAGPEFAEQYLQEVQAFFENLPYFAVIHGSQGLTFAGHSPVSKGGRNFSDLVAAREDRSGPNHRSPYLYNRPTCFWHTREERLAMGYDDIDVRMTLKRLFNCDGAYQMFGFPRALSETDLAKITVVSGHNRLDDLSRFQLEGFTNTIFCLQSFFSNPEIIEIEQGAISFTNLY